MLNLTIPLFRWILVGCISLWTMFWECKYSRAEVNCLKMDNFSSKENELLQNYFQLEIWSGLSDLKTNVWTLSKIKTGAVKLSKLGWYIFCILSARSIATYCFSTYTSYKSTKVIILNTFVVLFHSTKISPSFFWV